MLTKIDKTIILKYLKDGWLMRQKHPVHPLWIYNYTQKTQYERFWNETTLMCRGLILDDQFNIVVIPFKKFFNLSEHKQDGMQPIPNLPFEVTEKMDGSFLQIFKYKGETICASRGSFTSEQAIAAYEIISEKKDIYEKGKSYRFELIAPWNRVVVDYGTINDIVLLSVVDIKTNIEVPYSKLIEYEKYGYSVVKKYDGLTDLYKIKELIKDDHEGFVIKFSNGFMVKIKGDEYVRLHRIITEVSSKNIWEYLKDGKSLNEVLEKVPDEFFDWVKNVKKELEKQFEKIWFETIDIFVGLKHLRNDRKDFAIEITTNHKKEYSGILFNMFNSDLISVRKIIWKLIKPKFEKPFKNK